MTNNNASSDPYAPYRVKDPFPKEKLPIPIFDAEPGYIELYWKAWELAWAHVIRRNDTPQPWYMDEAMDPGQIWVWDSCFMAMFCRYGVGVFPGVETLNNFYYIIHDRRPSKVKIHFADNPPLFAWIEWAYFLITGDIERLRWLETHGYLEKHWEFIEHGKWRMNNRNVMVGASASRKKLGYTWRGNTSGMDNTPRGRNWWNVTKINPRGQIGVNAILWVDLLAQQALAADCIAKIYAILRKDEKERFWRTKYAELQGILNTYYWNESDAFYYDLNYRPAWWIDHLKAAGKDYQCRVPTIASYWPLLAGMSPEDRALALKHKAEDPAFFGGDYPWPSLARRDPDFMPEGRYWRGGVWLPTAYMATKALERYNYLGLACSSAEKLVSAMLDTYREFPPHTIWEAYSPSGPRPASQKKNEQGKTKGEFCGWSALGPISLFIENVLGFSSINANDKRIQWFLHQKCRHGIQHLKVGGLSLDFLYDAGKITVQSTGDMALEIVNSQNQPLQTYSIHAGTQEFAFTFQG